MEVEAIWEGFTTGTTRKLLARSREKWRFNTFERSMAGEGDSLGHGHQQQGPAGQGLDRFHTASAEFRRNSADD